MFRNLVYKVFKSKFINYRNIIVFLEIDFLKIIIQDTRNYTQLHLKILFLSHLRSQRK